MFIICNNITICIIVTYNYDMYVLYYVYSIIIYIHEYAYVKKITIYVNLSFNICYHYSSVILKAACPSVFTCR